MVSQNRSVLTFKDDQIDVHVAQKAYRDATSMPAYLQVPLGQTHEVNPRLPIIVDQGRQMSAAGPSLALLFPLAHSCVCPRRR